MTIIETAHDYVRRGWGVIPLHGWDAEKKQCRCSAGRFCPEKNRGKHPSLGNDWQLRALKSGPDVEAWWEDHPTNNVGILTGAESGIFVFDVDGAAGIKSVTAMASEHGALPPTRIVRTGSGGLHYFYRHPGHFVVHNSTSWIAPGIDIRGAGGQVVAPPSESGRGLYDVIADHPIAEAPEWMLTALKEHSENVQNGRTSEVKNAEAVDVALMPEAVRTAASTLIGEDQGRFRQFHHIIAACREAGYTQGQAVTIVAPWCVAVDKYVGRIEAEVARCWGKLEAEAQRANDWLEGISEPSKPPTQPAPATDGTAALKTQPVPEPATDTDDDLPDLLEPTWRPVDLEPFLTGTYVPEIPNLLPRTDNQHLLYAGRVHSMHGESESGKSLVAQAETARLLKAGNPVLYIDFESDAHAVVGRLLEMGCTIDQLRANLTYLRPDNDPRKFGHEREELFAVLRTAFTLIVIDGVTDALGVFGAGTTDNDEIAAFMRTFPRMLARKTGAAVVLIDHVTKDAESRGRYALGGQAKMNALDGSAFVVEVVEAIGRGMRGVIALRVAKDRPGGVRPHAGTFRKSDRTQEAARVVVDSTRGSIEVTVEPPSTNIGDAPKPGGQRPTIYMQRVSEFLERAVDGVTWNTIRNGVQGTEKYVKQATALLTSEGFVAVSKGANNAQLHTLTKPYNPDMDPASDGYIGWMDEAGGAGGAGWRGSGARATGEVVARLSPSPLGDSATHGDEIITEKQSSGAALEYAACNGCGDEYLVAALELGRGLCGECVR